MKKAKCYNCEKINHIKRHCKKFKKNKTFEKKNDSSDDNNKKIKKIRKKNSIIKQEKSDSSKLELQKII